MTTHLISVHVHAPEEQLTTNLTPPAKCLREGGTVAFPTETVYGLGADATSISAVQKIYKAKGRPSDNPLIVHIASLDMLEEIAISISDLAHELMHALWPGPITFVLHKHPSISSQVTGGLETIAVRMPSHPIALKLIALSGRPIAAPSANLSGKPSPTQSKDVIDDLWGRVDWIVEGGDAEVGLESTVLDVTGSVPMILRPGKVTQEEIIKIAGACEIDPAIMGASIDTSGIAKSPGMKYRHYAPEAEVHVYIGSNTEIVKTFFDLTQKQLEMGVKKVGIMAFEEDVCVLNQLFRSANFNFDQIEVRACGPSGDLVMYGKNLFNLLRGFDALNCDVIFVRGVDEYGIGHAIMNRLKKAADGKVTRI